MTGAGAEAADTCLQSTWRKYKREIIEFLLTFFTVWTLTFLYFFGEFDSIGWGIALMTGFATGVGIATLCATFRVFRCAVLLAPLHLLFGLGQVNGVIFLSWIITSGQIQQIMKLLSLISEKLPKSSPKSSLSGLDKFFSILHFCNFILIIVHLLISWAFAICESWDVVNARPRTTILTTQNRATTSAKAYAYAYKLYNKLLILLIGVVSSASFVLFGFCSLLQNYVLEHNLGLVAENMPNDKFTFIFYMLFVIITLLTLPINKKIAKFTKILARKFLSERPKNQHSQPASRTVAPALPQINLRPLSPPLSRNDLAPIPQNMEESQVNPFNF